MNAARTRFSDRLSSGTGGREEDDDLRRRLGTDPMDHPDHERRSPAVVHEGVVGLRMLVMMVPGASVMTVMPF